MDSAAHIQHVVIGFFVALDSFDVERALSLMTDDVEWVREGGTLRGREDVRRVLEARSRQRRTRHLVSNLDVTQQNSQTARARCDIVVYQGSAESDQNPLVIRGPDSLLSNLDDLAFQQGQWKISRKSPSTIFKFGS